MEAKVEGDARERLPSGLNIVCTGTGRESSSVLLSRLRCGFLAFATNLDGFGSGDDGLGDEGFSPAGGKDGGKADWAGERRLPNVWYEVVIAVVAVGPLAMGVRYSVCELRRSVDGDGDDERATFSFGSPGPPCLDFAASFASLEVGRSPEDAAELSAAV